MVASIEAPFALLEEPVKAFRLDTVKAMQVSFGLIPEIFYSIDMTIVFRKLLGMIAIQTLPFLFSRPKTAIFRQLPVLVYLF